MNDRRTFAAKKFAWLEALSVDRNLTALDCRVAIRISKYLNWKKHYAWPSQERLANDIDCTKRAVQFSLRRLSNFGYLRILSGSKRAGTNRYFILIPTVRILSRHDGCDEVPFFPERSDKSDMTNDRDYWNEPVFALNLPDNPRNERARVKARASSTYEESSAVLNSSKTLKGDGECKFAMEELDHVAQELDGYFIYDDVGSDDELDVSNGRDILY